MPDKNKHQAGDPSEKGSAVPQTGASSAMDQSIEEERQRRQENWAPAAQTGFDNADVERHEEIYTHEPPSDVEEEKRGSANG